MRLGRLRRSFSITGRSWIKTRLRLRSSLLRSGLTFVLHHAGLQVVAVARLLQAADDRLRRTAAEVHGASGGARAGRISRRHSRRVARGGAKSGGGVGESHVWGLLLVLQTVGIQLLIAEGAAAQRVTGRAGAPPGRGGGIVLSQTCRWSKRSTQLHRQMSCEDGQAGTYSPPACAPVSGHQ